MTNCSKWARPLCLNQPVIGLRVPLGVGVTADRAGWFPKVQGYSLEQLLLQELGMSVPGPKRKSAQSTTRSKVSC